MRIAVVAVQGAFREHELRLESLGVEWCELRQKRDLDQAYDALILPGGESTVQGKLLRELDMFDALKEQIQNKMPVLATCAGLILLADQLSNDERSYFRTLPVCVKRNAYGRQLGSFRTCEKFGELGNVPMTFIRAPYIERVAADANILAQVDSHIVAVQYQNQLALSFHPELDADLNIYKYFMDMIT
ncbi:MAG: pyridoxal 5'-phosphate synthase glutaminase subunit PdxT [Roseburia sp.]